MLLPVEEARARLLAGVTPLPGEAVPLADAGGRVLAEAIVARRTQPPFAGSSMDGYALAAGDTGAGARLRLVGESIAGRRHGRPLQAGEAVRIFTGAPLPEGADAVLPQEEAVLDGGDLVIGEAVEPGRFVRAAGIDFAAGEELLAAGRRLGPSELALAAIANQVMLTVCRRPRVAVLSIGDELLPPGSEPGPDQTIAANAFAIIEIARRAGAEVKDLGIIPDDAMRITAAAAEIAERADILVTIGGASVGDRDVTRPALAAAGMSLDFWKIAMRPGKPLAFGRLGPIAVLGLPGNPVSSFVCGLIFLKPLIEALLGISPGDESEPAILAADMPANGERTAYLRATLVAPRTGLPMAAPLPDQDSSLLTVLTRADCLLLRPAHAPAAKAGDPCTILRL